jgi:predicted nuclease of predicted toxin-antitoxin system
MKIKTQILVVLILAVVTARAQEAKDRITLSGNIHCIDPVNGSLSSVIVYNVTQGYGTSSNQDGTFAIEMSKSDTILFATAEHKDYLYSLSKDDEFIDHEIKVVMVTDVVWLNTVTIIGAQNLEKFRRDVLSLDIPPENQQLVLPLVNKYARQLATGDGETDLVGPLTYLQKKFNRHDMMKKKVEQVKSFDHKE